MRAHDEQRVRRCLRAVPYFYKSFITKVLKYKAGLNRRIKFVWVAMCYLVMSLCSCDLLVMSLNTIQHIEDSQWFNLHTAPGF